MLELPLSFLLTDPPVIAVGLRWLDGVPTGRLTVPAGLVTAVPAGRVTVPAGRLAVTEVDGRPAVEGVLFTTVSLLADGVVLTAVLLLPVALPAVVTDATLPLPDDVVLLTVPLPDPEPPLSVVVLPVILPDPVSYLGP